MEQRWLMGWWKEVEAVGDVKVWRCGEAVVRSVGGVRGGRWDFVGRDDGETPRCIVSIVMGLKEKRGDFSAARVAESDVCAARVRGMRCNGLSLTRVLFVVMLTRM